MPDGTIFQYDVFKSISAGSGYAEKYNPTTNTWSSVSPGDGTANGFLPILSTGAVGDELGPTVRLQDGRILVIGRQPAHRHIQPRHQYLGTRPGHMGTITAFNFLRRRRCTRLP